MSLTISEASVSLVLKEATIELHQQAEAILYPRLEGIASLNDYTSILKMFYGFFHPFQAEISEHITEKVLHDFSERRKSDLIIDDLQALGNETQNLKTCAALPVQPGKGHFIIAFRPEAIQKVNWGGNTNQAVTFEADGQKYHPRNSFKLWQQTVKHAAIPWKNEELEVAEQFRNFVIDYTLNKIYS